MLKPTGEVFQDVKFTSTHPFKFDGTTIQFGNSANRVPILDGSALLPVANIPGLPASIITSGTFPDARIASASTWNAKENPLTFSSPLSRSTNTISIPVATSSANGYLASADWTTFNNKQNAISTGSTAQYFRGDLSLATLNKAAVAGLHDNDSVLFAYVQSSGATAGFLFAERDATGLDWIGYASGGNFNLYNGSDRFRLGASGIITLATWQGVAVADTYIASAGTWNGKENVLTFSGPLSRSTNTISIANAAADGATKGAATFTAADFDAATGVISIDYTNGQAATTSVKGFLTSTDWTTFNNKVGTARTISTTAPLAGGGDLSANRTFSITQSTTSVDGYLSATDWTTFNNKVATTRSISTTAPLAGGGDLSANRTFSIADAAADGTTKGASTFIAADFNAATGVISIDYTNGQAATTSVKGFLTAADWTTFNGKESALTFSSPLSRSTNTISIPLATSSANGYLASADWTTFNNKIGAITANNGITQSVASGTATLGLGNLSPTGDITLAASKYLKPSSYNTDAIQFNGDSFVTFGMYNSGSSYWLQTTYAESTTTTVSGIWQNFDNLRGFRVLDRYTGLVALSSNLNATNAGDYTIGVNGSYSPNVVPIGDSITQLVANLGASKSVTTSSGSATITFTAGVITDKDVGSAISGTGIPANSYVGSLVSSTSATLSSWPLYNIPATATASGSITATVTPYGYNAYMGAAAGTGSENFTVPAIGTFNGMAVAPTIGQNVGVAGWKIQDISEHAYLYNSKFRQEAGMNIAVVLAGTNNLPTETPAQVFSELKALCEKLRRNGWRVIVVGLISRGNGAGSSPGAPNSGQTWDQLVGSVNNLIRQDWAQMADRFVDWGIIGGGVNEFAPGQGTAAYTNTTWYSTDQLHPTFAGERKLASYVQPYINDLLSLYFQVQRNQLFVNWNNGSAHNSNYVEGMITLNNENPAGTATSSINFAFGKTVKGSIWADANGATNFDQPLQVIANNIAATSKKGAVLTYSSSLDYAILTAFDGPNTAWKPWLYQGSTHKFATAGTDALFIDGSQNVGIGTVSPGRRLDVAGPAGTATALAVFDKNATGNGIGIGYTGTYGYISTQSAIPMVFMISGTEKMRMNNGLDIGGTTDAGTGNVMLAGSSAKGGVLWFGNDGTRYLQYNTGVAAYDFGNAGVYANGVLLTSSRTVKQNIRDWKPSRAGRLKPRLFERPVTPGVTELSFVAEEVAEVLPEAVRMGPSADPKNPKALVPAIDPMAIIAKHELELQEISARLDAVHPAPWWYAPPEDPVTPPLKR